MFLVVIFGFLFPLVQGMDNAPAAPTMTHCYEGCIFWIADPGKLLFSINILHHLHIFCRNMFWSDFKSQSFILLVAYDETPRKFCEMTNTRPKEFSEHSVAQTECSRDRNCVGFYGNRRRNKYVLCIQPMVITDTPFDSTLYLRRGKGIIFSFYTKRVQS